MTTVGYGDKAPTTLGGRLLATVWMFVSIITISGFTAAIASSFTINQLQSAVSGIDDLPRAKTVTVAGSSAAEFLTNQNIRYRTVESVETGLAALSSGEVDAVVYDAPLLSYLLNGGDYSGVEVLPTLLTRQNYALALAPGLAEREAINRALLKIVQSDRWQDRLQQYLGNSE